MITLLNLIRIIYSHIILHKYKDIKLDSEVVSKIIESHFTANLSNYEICVWIKYLKSIGKCSGWNEYQMYREWLYHKNLYKHHLFSTHTDYVDFEEEQTTTTYLKRIVGNCFY